MKPKVALVKDGFLPPGSENTRGRMSKAAITRCEELAAQGWKIDGFSAVKSSDTSKPVTVERVSVDPNRIADVPDMARDERDFTAWVTREGKPEKIGMREVCNGCRSSFTYCHCSTPRFWLDHTRESVVTFKPMKGAV